MPTYTATFKGRQIHAIGIIYPIHETVNAFDKEEARIKLYDKYEHIAELQLTEIKQG